MGYDEKLAERIRENVSSGRGVSEKKMFGGIAFLLNGKMFCGVVKDQLMARIGKENHKEAISKPHVAAMDFTGRPMEGFVYVKAPGLKSKRQLAAWINLAKNFVATLPAKKRSTRSKRE